MWSRLKSVRADQRGAAAVLFALLLPVILIAAALAVDLGQQRVVRSDMQALADVVALDVVRELGTAQTKDQLTTSGTIATARNRSVNRNVGTYGDAPTVTVDLGKLNSSGVFVTVAGGDVPSAVQVTAKAAVNYAFVKASGGAVRTAVAQRSNPYACYHLGSFAAGIDLANSSLANALKLKDLLGLDTKLDLVHYDALAKANVSLAGIKAGLPVATQDAVLGSSQLTVGQLIDASIYALQHDPESQTADAAAAITALNALKIANVTKLGNQINLGKVVSVGLGDSSVLNTQMNLLDLIGPSVSIANGKEFVNATVPINLPTPPFAGSPPAVVDVKAIQRPQRKCGQPNTEATHATQGQVTVSADVPALPVELLKVGSDAITATIGPIAIRGGVGNGEGQLVDPPAIQCGAGTAANPDKYTVDVRAGLLGLGVSAPVTINGTVPLVGELLNTVLNTLNLGNLLVSLGLPIVGARRNFDVGIELDHVSLNLGDSQLPGTGSTWTPANLKVPQNVKGGSEGPKHIAAPAPSLNSLDIPINPLSGSIKLKLKSQEYKQTGFLQYAWVNVDESQTYNLSNLASLPLVGAALQTLLAGVKNTVNTAIGVVNGLVADLSALLGLSGSGVDVFAEARPSCGGQPRLVG